MQEGANRVAPSHYKEVESIETKSFIVSSITKKEKISMLDKDYTAKLLNLEDVIITNVEEYFPEKSMFISNCRGQSTAVLPARCSRTVKMRLPNAAIKDIPLWQNNAGICASETLPLRYCALLRGKRLSPRYHRATRRLVAEIINGTVKLYLPQKSAHSLTSSGTTAMRYLKYISFKPTKLPRVLSIDEFGGKFRRPKYNSIVVNAENHKVLGHFTKVVLKTTLSGYFSQFQSKTDVKYFVFNMNPHFSRELPKRVSQRYRCLGSIPCDSAGVLGYGMCQKRMSRISSRPASARVQKIKMSSDEAQRKARTKKRDKRLMFEIAPSLADAYRLKQFRT